MRVIVFVYFLLFASFVRGDCNQCSTNNGVKIENKRYYVEKYFKANFYAATEYCRSYNMHLASINSQEESDGLAKYIQAIGYGNERFWTSGNDLGKTGSYNWMSTGAPMIFRNFLPTDPNHLASKGEVEHCIEIWNKTGFKEFKWNDHYCSVEKFFVCETYECDSISYRILP